MPVATAVSGKEFKKASEGTHQSVLNSIDDLGIEDVVYQGKSKKVHMLRLFWQTEEKDDDGSPVFVTEKMSLSLHEKSKLYARVKGLFGKNPPASLDTDKLIGTNTNIVVVHNPGKGANEGKTYANIVATLKLRPDQKKLEIIPRKKKEDATPLSNAGTAVTEDNPITSEDVPW